MNIIKKEKTKYIKKLKIFNFEFYKKEKYVSSSFYSLFGVCFYKIKKFALQTNKYICGIRVSSKHNDTINSISKYSEGKPFIYISYHTGEFYYLCCLLEKDFNSFKDINIITKFAYLKDIMHIFDIPRCWIETHFIVIPIFIPSCVFFMDRNKKNFQLIETNYETGFTFNGKSTDSHITTLLTKMLDKKTFEFKKPDRSAIVKNNNTAKTVLIFPESIFNGNIDLRFLENICNILNANGIKVLINSKNSQYDSFLNENVSKIFLNLDDTYRIVSSCNAVFGVRSGFFDCIQGYTHFGIDLYIVYNNYCFPSYNRMKNFKSFFKNAYSLNFCNKNRLHEYFYIKQSTADAYNIANTIIENIGRN